MRDPLRSVWREHDKDIPCEEVFPGCFVAQTEPMTIKEACRLYFEPSELFSKPLVPKERKSVMESEPRPLAVDEYWVVEDKHGSLVTNPGSGGAMLSKFYAFAKGFKNKGEKIRRARVTVEVIE